MRSITTKKLTISIVTADRPCLESCLIRLKYLPQIDEVEVIVVDNSKNKSRSDINENICDSLGFQYYLTNNLMSARNLALAKCNTEFFTILDDDDFYAVDAITRMLRDIDQSTEETDMICYKVERVGRISNFDGLTTIFRNPDKLRYFNNFDNYDLDRLNKIYLWNCGIVFRTSLLRAHCEWLYYGCDDIYPVTKAYIEARDVVSINIPIYYYPKQTTIESKKSATQLSQLDQSMYNSYSRLLSEYNVDNPKFIYAIQIIKRGIHNSTRQMQVLDLYEPEILKKLCIF